MRNMSRGFVWVLCAAMPVLALAQQAPAPTPEQMAIFQSLPPEVQQQIIEQAIGRQTQQGRGQQQATESDAAARAAPAPKPEELNLRIRPEFTGEPVLRSGDTVIVELEIIEPKPGEPALDLAFRERARGLIERAARGNPFGLNASGALALPGIGPVTLAGLTIEEATARLERDPALLGLEVRLRLLPLDAQGAGSLKPFGYELFRKDEPAARPETGVPVPADYVVGPGDVLEVQLYGKESGRYTLEVGRDGKVDFPKLGPIAVAGLPYESMRSLLERRVGEQLIGVEVSVSLGELRGMQVYVLGDAERPGAYTVSALSTITNALLESGGVKEIGSLRRIELKRRGETVRRLDLYDVLLRGDTRNDTRLLPGDVIFIPPVGATVGVHGAVRRPAIYELAGETTAAQLVELAGGLRPDADRGLARLTRIQPGSARAVMDLDFRAGGAGATRVVDGDTLQVFAIRPELEGSVQLSGHVFRAAPSGHRPGMRLTDVITSPMELRPNADLGYVLIRRETGPARTVEVLSADLEAALAAPGSAADPVLQPRDHIYVFDREGGREAIVEPILRDLERQATPQAPAQIVSIHGRVRAPGRYPLEPGMTAADLVRAGGGLQDAAYSERAELARYEVRDGVVRQTALIEVPLAAVLRGDQSADVALQAYDYLNITEVEDWGKQGTVELVGEVRFPGRYPIRRGETLRSVIDRAGGLTPLAFPAGSVFTRLHLREREREQLRTLADRLEADLASLALQSAQAGGASQGAQALAVGQQLLTQLQTAEPVGRLVIDLPQIVNSQAGGPLDVVLRDGDRLMVSKVSQEVTVLGEVQNSTSHFYRPGVSRDDYIEMSGGLTARADKKRIYVVKADGSVVAERQRGWFGQGDAAISAGDTVVVPLEADRIRPLTLWTSVTQILYNVAVAVAAVNSF